MGKVHDVIVLIRMRSFLVTALPSHVCGVGLALVCHPIIAPMWPTWGQQLLSRSVAGVSLLLIH